MGEETRFHSLNALVNIARIKLDRADQEKRWQEGNGRMLRDFASFKDLYQVMSYEFGYTICEYMLKHVEQAGTTGTLNKTVT